MRDIETNVSIGVDRLMDGLSIIAQSDDLSYRLRAEIR